MTTPGSNTLRMALARLGKQQVLYFPCLGRVTDARGVDVTQYDTPVTVAGSVQPVALKNYQYMGLDLSKRYVKFWATKDMQPFDRDTSGDSFNWNGMRWQILNDDDWASQDGWKSVMAVADGPAMDYDHGFFGFGPGFTTFGHGNFYAGQ